jgi:hypothetical protein
MAGNLIFLARESGWWFTRVPFAFHWEDSGGDVILRAGFVCGVRIMMIAQHTYLLPSLSYVFKGRECH